MAIATAERTQTRSGVRLAEFGAARPAWRHRTLARCLDVVGASMALLVATPVLLLAALAIRLTSPGPVLFRQDRVGLGGGLFTLLKLRTMRVGADPGPHLRFVQAALAGERAVGEAAMQKLVDD